MTKQHEFDSYHKYVTAQTDLTRFKVNRKKTTRCFATNSVVNSIVECHPGTVKKGLCHGVRFGTELDMFEEALPGSAFFGTEIFPDVCDGTRVLNQDFDVVPAEWLESFDLIYSNSFDHSRDPRCTAFAWMQCLSSAGHLYIEWTPWHNKLGGRGNRADCYAATLEEYMDVFSEFGIVTSVLSLFDKCERKILVVQCKKS